MSLCTAVGPNRATITLTLSKNAGIEKDSYVDENIPGENNGDDGFMSIGGQQAAADRRWGLMNVSLPAKPQDCDDGEDYDGVVSITLKLYLSAITGGDTSPQNIDIVRVALEDTWEEMTVTWTNKPDLGTGISQNSIALSPLGYKDFLLTVFRELGLTWGTILDFWIRDVRDQAAKWSVFRSRNDPLISQMPYLVITYKQVPPEQITDLAIIPDPNDAKRPKLTWTPSTDDNFSHYQICRKVGAADWDQAGSNITVQGQGEYVDTGSLTENEVIYYKVREENGDGSWIDSNEVWMIRPDISTFTVSDTTPDVLQNLTFTVSAVAYPTTPTPVTQEWYEFYFGTTAQADASSCRVRELTRTHRYPHYGSQTPKVQIENSLGFKSDLTDLTTGGPTLTVTDVVPVAIIRASPVVVEVNMPIRFFADESYCPAGNQEVSPVNGYEWDKDYSVSFVADDITSLPYKDYFWASSGTKTVAMRVKDVAAKYSIHVTIQVLVVTVITVDLDTALTDGYETIDADVARTIAISEGMQVKKMTRGSLKIIPVMIGGFAYTDSGGVANVPDDIETLQDIVTNNKRIHITVHGVVHYGSLNFKSHHEAGWLDKFNWVAQLYLE